MSYNSPKSKAVNWEAIARNVERKLYKNCKGCKHLDQKFNCAYILNTDRSRVATGVKTRPGGGCDLYKAKKSTLPVRPGILITKGVAQKMREAAKTPSAPNLLSPGTESHKIALDLYNKGAGDAQIANTVGCTRQTIRAWREENNMESNYSKFRKEKPL